MDYFCQAPLGVLCVMPRRGTICEHPTRDAITQALVADKLSSYFLYPRHPHTRSGHDCLEKKCACKCGEDIQDASSVRMNESGAQVYAGATTVCTSLRQCSGAVRSPSSWHLAYPHVSTLRCVWVYIPARSRALSPRCGLSPAPARRVADHSRGRGQWDTW